MDHHPLGALIVGTGFGVLAHVRAMQAAGINVHALVGRDAAKAKDRAARFDVALGTDQGQRSGQPRRRLV